MAYLINEECINCAACEQICPNEAIYETEAFYAIDPNKCTQCVGNFRSLKCVEICPVEACQPDPGNAESTEQLLEKWRSLHPGKNPAPGTF